MYVVVQKVYKLHDTTTRYCIPYGLLDVGNPLSPPHSIPKGRKSKTPDTNFEAEPSEKKLCVFPNPLSFSLEHPFSRSQSLSLHPKPLNVHNLFPPPLHTTTHTCARGAEEQDTRHGLCKYATGEELCPLQGQRNNFLEQLLGLI